MPIYEFLCPSCNRILQFFSRRPNTETVPACPHCHGPLTREIEDFVATRTDGPTDEDAENERIRANVDKLLGRLEKGEAEESVEKEFDQMVDENATTDRTDAPVAPTAQGPTPAAPAKGAPTRDPTLYDLPSPPLPPRKPNPYR